MICDHYRNQWKITLLDTLLKFSTHNPQKKLCSPRVNMVNYAITQWTFNVQLLDVSFVLISGKFSARKGGGVLPYWAIRVCAAPKGMVFERFLSEKGIDFEQLL